MVCMRLGAFPECFQCFSARSPWVSRAFIVRFPRYRAILCVPGGRESVRYKLLYFVVYLAVGTQYGVKVAQECLGAL